jgi:hypothetical protein
MPPIKATQEVIMVIGQMGSDGGYFVVTPKGLKRVPDNNPGFKKAYAEIVKNYDILKKAALEQRL